MEFTSGAPSPCHQELGSEPATILFRARVSRPRSETRRRAWAEILSITSAIRPRSTVRVREWHAPAALVRDGGLLVRAP